MGVGIISVSQKPHHGTSVGSTGTKGCVCHGFPKRSVLQTEHEVLMGLSGESDFQRNRTWPSEHCGAMADYGGAPQGPVSLSRSYLWPL